MLSVGVNTNGCKLALPEYGGWTTRRKREGIHFKLVTELKAIVIAEPTNSAAKLIYRVRMCPIGINLQFSA